MRARKINKVLFESNLDSEGMVVVTLSQRYHISRALLRRWWWLLTKYSHVSLRPSCGRYLPRLFKSRPTPVLSTLFSVLNVMPRSSFQLRDPPNRNSNLVQMQHCSSSNTILCSVWIFSISGCWTENEGSDEMTTIFRPRHCSLGNLNTMQHT